MDKKKNKIILIYPSLGTLGNAIIDLPVSLLYASSGVVSGGYDVRILDFRVERNWRNALDETVDEETLLIGVSVMAGLPIKNVVAVCQYIKSRFEIPIVLGGPHPTILPEQVNKHQFVDYVIQGNGSRPLKALADAIGNDTPDLKQIIGLCWKTKERIILNASENGFEHIYYEDLPYALFKKYFPKYVRVNETDMVFPIYGSYGCPYRCSFCMAASRYSRQRQKWMPLDPDYVIEHIRFLINRYNARYFYFYDDTALVDKKRTMLVLRAVRDMSVEIKIGFRGMRIDELCRLESDDLSLMSEVGVDKIHIGVESGSNRMLEYYNKGIKIDQIVDINQRLAAKKGIVPLYNFMSGSPGETLNDLKQTKELMLRLVKDNPNCFILPINKYQPYPGSPMFKDAVRLGFDPPDTLCKWIDIDLENDICFPWYTKDYGNYINMLNLASYFIDRKLLTLPFKSVFMKVLILAAYQIGKMIFMFRMKRNFAWFLFEKKLFDILKRFLSKQSS